LKILVIDIANIYVYLGPKTLFCERKPDKNEIKNTHGNVYRLFQK